MPTFSERLAEAAQMPLSPQKHIDRLQALIEATRKQNSFDPQPNNGMYEIVGSPSMSIEEIAAMFEPLVTTPESVPILPSQEAFREQKRDMDEWGAIFDRLRNADYSSDIEAKEEELRESNKKQYQRALQHALLNLTQKHTNEEMMRAVESYLPPDYTLANPYDDKAYTNTTPVGGYNPVSQRLIVSQLAPAIRGRPSKFLPTEKDDELEDLLLNLERQTGVSGTRGYGWDAPSPPPQDELQQILQYARNPAAAQEQFGDIQMSASPMDLAFRLLKERKSPEAMRHKLEYDKEYESSPERVKYRVELNRERRRRGIMGSHNHKDISHTQGGRLTLENEHDNRARHFKNRGTLRQIE